MREMTEQEKILFYKERTLPCGCGTEYYEGPCGGMMQNIECASCGLRLNVMDPQSTTVAMFSAKNGLGRHVPLSDIAFGQIISEPVGYKVKEIRKLSLLEKIKNFLAK